MRMHNEYQTVSRGSIARGLSIKLPESFNDPELMATYSYTQENEEGGLKREEEK